MNGVVDSQIFVIFHTHRSKRFRRTVGIDLSYFSDVARNLPQLYRLLSLSSAVETEARSIYRIRLLLIPLVLVQRVCNGLLGGFQRLRTLAALAITVAVAEVASQWIALFGLRSGLVGASFGAIATAGFGATAGPVDSFLHDFFDFLVSVRVVC